MPTLILENKYIEKVSCGNACIIALGNSGNVEKPTIMPSCEELYKPEEFVVENMPTHYPIHDTFEKQLDKNEIIDSREYSLQDNHTEKEFYPRNTKENLVMMLREEQRKRKELENIFENLQSDKSMQSIDSKNISLNSSESRIFSEIEKKTRIELERKIELEKELEEIEKHNSMLNNERFALQNKLDELRDKSLEMHEESKRSISRDFEQTSVSRLSDLLKEFEDKIENEIKSKELMEICKDQEINELRDQSEQLQLKIKQSEQDLDQVEINSKAELLDLEQQLEESRRHTSEEQVRNEEFQIVIKKKEFENEKIECQISNLRNQKVKLEETFSECQSSLENSTRISTVNQQNIDQIENNITLLTNEIQMKNKELQVLTNSYNENEAQFIEKINTLERFIEEKNYDNENIIIKINQNAEDIEE